MATVSTRSFVILNCENHSSKGKPVSRLKSRPTRAPLVEIGNNLISRPALRKIVSQKLKDPEKKPVTLPTVKQPITKRPSIQVKETKSYRLRIVHNRQSSCVRKSERIAVSKEAVIKDEPKIGKDKKVSQPEANHRTISQRPRSLPKIEDIDKNTEDKSATNPSLGVYCPVPDLTKAAKSNRHEIGLSFSSTLLNCLNVIDIDNDDKNDPVMLGGYANDIYQYLREFEVKVPISAEYLKNSSLTGDMRATLINWLVEVTTEFELCAETLYLTVAIIDRFLEKTPDIKKDQLQLVGITALFISSKYEEIALPDINELVYVTDNSWAKKDILKMEKTIVKTLGYTFGRPLPIHFLRRFSKADGVLPVVHVMAKYIMEIGNLTYSLCHVRPSLLAATALYVSLWLLVRKDNIWSNNLLYYSNYTEKDILPVVKSLCKVVINATSCQHLAVTEKYSHPKNLQVSAFPIKKHFSNLYEKL